MRLLIDHAIPEIMDLVEPLIEPRVSAGVTGKAVEFNVMWGIGRCRSVEMHVQLTQIKSPVQDTVDAVIEALKERMDSESYGHISNSLLTVYDRPPELNPETIQRSLKKRLSKVAR